MELKLTKIKGNLRGLTLFKGMRPSKRGSFPFCVSVQMRGPEHWH